MTALGTISCIFLPKRVGRGDIRVEGPPRTKDGKKSEHSSEGEKREAGLQVRVTPPSCHCVELV